MFVLIMRNYNLRNSKTTGRCILKGTSAFYLEKKYEKTSKKGNKKT